MRGGAKDPVLSWALRGVVPGGVGRTGPQRLCLPSACVCLWWWWAVFKQQLASKAK